jgi:hypothetical protein
LISPKGAVVSFIWPASDTTAKADGIVWVPR